MSATNPIIVQSQERRSRRVFQTSFPTHSSIEYRMPPDTVTEAISCKRRHVRQWKRAHRAKYKRRCHARTILRHRTNPCLREAKERKKDAFSLSSANAGTPDSLVVWTIRKKKRKMLRTLISKLVATQCRGKENARCLQLFLEYCSAYDQNLIQTLT